MQKKQSNGLRIYMLLDRYLPIVGGAERQAAQLAQELLKRGHSIMVVTRRIRATLPKEEVIDAVPVTRLTPTGLGHLSNALMVGRVFVYLLKHSQEYDIVHAHSIGPLEVAAVLAGKITKKPVVVKIATYGGISRSETGYTPPLYTRLLRRYVLTQRLWLSLLRSAAAIVTMTEEIVEEAKQNNLEHLIVKIPNGVNTSQFRPIDSNQKLQIRQKLGLPEARTLILFSGRLVARKRLDILLHALPDILAKYPECHLLVAGTGTDQRDSVETELKSLSISLGLDDHVTFLGSVENMLEYWQASDLFAFPSEREGMPNVILEAMAMGMPIVASQTGGVTDLLDNSTAWLVPPGDPQAFSAAIDEALANPSLSAQKGAKARSIAEESYSLQSVAKQYEELYKRILLQR